MNKLKELRESKGLSQPQISEKVGISLRAYQYYESGERMPDVDTAIKIAGILDTTTENIWGEEK